MKWEYTSFKSSLEEGIEHLNKMGKEGWELSSVINAQDSKIGMVVFLLKRPKE